MATNYQGGGDSVIFQNFQPLINIMQNNDKMQMAREAENRKQAEKISYELSKDIARVNSSGIREVDLPDFNESLKQAREKYFQMGRASSQEERTKLAMEVRQYLGEASYIKDLSKATMDRLNKAEGSILSMYGKGNLNEARGYLSSIRNRRSADIGESDIDLSRFYYTYDQNKRDKAISDLASSLLKDPSSISVTRNREDTLRTSGGRSYDFIRESTVVNDDKIFEGISKLAQSNRDVGNYVQSLVDQGIPYNDAIAQVAEESLDLFRTTRTERLTADKPRGGGITIINSPNETVSENYFTSTVGVFTSTESTTYKETVPLIGERDVYSSDGTKYTMSFTDVDFNGQALLTLPVDAGGNPLPTDNKGQAENEDEVAGYGRFVAGTLPKEEYANFYELLDPGTRKLYRGQALVPMSQIQWIGQPKAKRGELVGEQKGAQNRNTAPRKLQGGSVR